MCRSLWIALVMALLLPAVFMGQTTPAHGAPTPDLGRQPGLLDSMKQASTARGVDYGQQIEDVRNVLVESTIKSYEFWITVLSLSLNLALLSYVVYLDAVRRQVIRSTARLVATYQSQLATGQRSYLLLEQNYSKFRDDFEQEKEPRISTRPPVQKARNAGDTRVIPTDPRTPILVAGSPQPLSSTTAAPAEEAVVSMRRQITTLTHQLEEERQKNRKLRGE
jgi:hypothetical protein